ncbi:MAG: glycosyltransferase [Bacteroidetes bacterium]|jgi:GT2 family glycosyltransferase|nr:glycosyltransferase [Bacteroidota bacterium]
MTNSKDQPDISVIIVNYNVKEFLANCLQSVRKATEALQTEIFVVDNASSDGSIPFLKHRFKDVTFIENRENLGFGKANNQAIQKANGRYTLLLNPDTLLQEDTLHILRNYMDEHKACGACGCKILNPDGTFAPESRRSIPTVSAAVYKAIGLTAMFPKSRHFGSYYQGWKDEDEGGEVPVLSGSFMFFRTECLKQVGGFDERFFMYGEDIDLCYRVSNAGWQIHYVPDTAIIHYKGESTKKNELAYNRVFNNAIYTFFDKHYTSRYSHLFKFIIFWVIQLRALVSFFVNNIYSRRYVIADLLILNLSLLTGMFIRASFDPRGILSMLNPEFLWLHLLWSLLYLFFAQAYGLLKEDAFSIVGSLKAVFFSFLMLVAITFFIRSIAFSRIILAVSFILGITFVGIVRFMRVNRLKSTKLSRGKLNPLQMVLVGDKEAASSLKQKINSKAGWQVQIAGTAQIINNGREDRSEIEKLREMVAFRSADVVVFLMESVTHKQLVESIRELHSLDVEIKVVPESMDFILGKSDVEYFDTLPAPDLDLNYNNPAQKIFKRLFDVTVGLAGYALLLPVAWAWFFRSKDKRIRVPVYDGHQMRQIILNSHSSFAGKVSNRLRICNALLSGAISLVGAPADLPSDNRQPEYRYRTGLTGYVQINRDRISENHEREQYHLHYLQKYSIWLDLDILFKALIREESLTGALLDSLESGTKM